MIPSVIEPATFRTVAQCPNLLRHRLPPTYKLIIGHSGDVSPENDSRSLGDKQYCAREIAMSLRHLDMQLYSQRRLVLSLKSSFVQTLQDHSLQIFFFVINQLNAQILAL